MKLFGRQDLLLIGALTTALIVIFSSPISRLLDYAREIERQYSDLCGYVVARARWHEAPEQS